jgi:phosphate transport system permease protein
MKGGSLGRRQEASPEDFPEGAPVGRLNPSFSAGDAAAMLARRLSLRRAAERAIRSGLFLCALLSVATSVGIVVVLLNESVFSIGAESAFFEEVSVREFLTGTKWSPQYADKRFGVLPLLAGTFLVAGIAAAIALPLGLASAVYLSELASSQVRNVAKPILEILAGVPTVIYGYFALVFVTPYVLRPIFQDLLGFEVSVFNAASAGIVVAIMIVPMVSSLSEDALRAVPRGLREAGYALGATKSEVSLKVAVPAAFSGIVAAFLLAISRAVGETMAVAIAAGQSPTLTLNPLESIQSMTAYVVSVTQGDAPTGTIEYKSLYAVALTLFVITLAMNVVAQFVLRRYREVYE